MTEISFNSNSITGDYIATKFGTCHDSPAVVPCAKYCSNHFISIWMRAKWNFHHIWIVMEKLLVKWAPRPRLINVFFFSIPIRWEFRFPFPSFLIQWRNKFRRWLVSCALMACEKMLRFDVQQRCYSETKFLSNLNCRQKIVTETDLWTQWREMIKAISHFEVSC